MNKKRTKTRLAVRRDHSETYILVSLVSFAVTVIGTRVFLQLTGFPQIGNSVLHIAHALWGGLFLFVAAFLPLAYANRWAIQTSAILSGVGIGLFIDEIGKFITQANDYFFPPALPLIYGFFLLTVFIYLRFRRPKDKEARSVMYHVFDRLQDALDGDLDTDEAKRLEAQLAIAKQSDKEEIATLAKALSAYLEQEKNYLAEAEPDFLKQIEKRIDAAGRWLGRPRHRMLISGVLLGWMIFVLSYIVIMFQGMPNLDPDVVRVRIPLMGIQVVVGVLMSVAIWYWYKKDEEQGLKFGVSGFLLSLIALQTIYFYITQFSAITSTLLQLAFLLILQAYRRWYFWE